MGRTKAAQVLADYYRAVQADLERARKLDARLKPGWDDVVEVAMKHRLPVWAVRHWAIARHPAITKGSIENKGIKCPQFNVTSPL